jgi:hypothetical protein
MGRSARHASDLVSLQTIIDDGAQATGQFAVVATLVECQHDVRGIDYRALAALTGGVPEPLVAPAEDAAV